MLGTHSISAEFCPLLTLGRARDDNIQCQWYFRSCFDSDIHKTNKFPALMVVLEKLSTSLRRSNVLGLQVSHHLDVAQWFIWI